MLLDRQLITIDIDDVIADGTEAFRLEVNKHTGANLTAEDYRVPHTTYDRYYEHVWAMHGLNVEYDVLAKPMLIDQLHVPLVPGADQGLRRLHESYDLMALTARPASWEVATIAYLGNKLADLALDVHFIDKRPGITKGQICKELGAAWHIDDNPEHCQSVLDEGLGAILFGDYGWHYAEPKGVVKCRDWAAVVRFFEGLTNSEV